MSFTVIPVRPGVLLSDDEFQRIVGGFVRSLQKAGVLKMRIYGTYLKAF